MGVKISLNFRLAEKQRAAILKKGRGDAKEEKNFRLLKFGTERCQLNKN